MKKICLFVHCACILRGIIVSTGIVAIVFQANDSVHGSEKRPERSVNIVMEDQFRTRHETGTLRGDVVVLVYAERHGSDAARSLGRRLHIQFHPTAEKVPLSESFRQPVVGLTDWPAGIEVPNVHVIAVACLSEIPKPFHAVARAKFRSDSPHVPVWLDFENIMKKSCGLSVGIPNIVILDTEGKMRDTRSGHVDEREFDELTAAINLLRRESEPRNRAVGSGPLPSKKQQ